MQRRTGLLAMGAVAVFAAGLQTGVAADVKKITTIEGITEYHFENGFKALLFPDASKPTVTVNLTILVGSRHEGYGEAGMAHLLEHMVFKGTPTHPDVPKALKEHGAQFNGTTWVDRTNYFETMPATDETLEFGIKLEADRMMNSFVKREDLISEMTVVRNEFESGENNPERVLSQRMMATAYEWHNYGKSTIGNRSDIERVPIDRLQAFYKKYYQPDNAVLIVAGKFDEKKALEYVTKYFGSIKKPTRVLDATYTEEPAQDGERVVNLRRVGKVGVVGLIYHMPAGSHEDFPAVEVLNSILNSEPSGRLYKALVETKKANSISGSAFAWHDPGVLEISAEVDAAKPVEDVRDTMIKILENLGKDKITEEEVERAKTKFKKNRELQLTKSSSVAIALSEWVSKGDWRLFFLHRDRIAKVTPADVQRVAGKYLLASNRTTGVFVPTAPSETVRATIPAAPDVTALVKDYKGQGTIAAGEAFDPTPENIEKRVKRIIPEKGGVKVALLPKKSRGEAVTLNLTLRFGDEKSLTGKTTAAGLLGTMLSRGSEKYTQQQLQDELDKLGARMSISSGTAYVTVSIETKRAILPKVIALLTEVLQKPTFPAAEFDIVKRETRDGLQKAVTEPTSLAFRAVQRKLNPYSKDDVRYVPTYEEDIANLDAVTVEQLKELYKQVSGQAATLSVVGDFEEPSASSKSPISDLIKFLNDWKSTQPYVRSARPAKIDTAAVKDNILTPDKANAMYVAGHNLAINDADPDYAALEVGNFILGGGTLSSRLGNRVRQKEGLSYGVASVFNADSKDKSGRLFMYAITNPVNIDKVDKAIAEELEKLLKDGVSQTELDDATKSWLERRKVQRSTDAALASQLDSGLFLDRTFGWHADLEKKVGALKVAEVNAALKKNFVPKKLVIIQAGDFKKQ